MIRQIHKLADKHENKGARVFHAALKKQLDSAASFIEKGGNIDGLEIYPIPLRDAMRSFHQMVQMDSAELQYRDLRKNNPVKAGIGTEISTQWLRQIQAWVLLNTGDHITKINDTTLDRIRSIHAAGIAEGLGPRDIAARIRKQAGEPFTVYRSTVIARTESTRSASQGHKIGAEAWEKETGQKTYKQWSATNDSRTRDAHRAMLVLHIIPKGEMFLVGGVEMDAPGDPKGGAKNVVNCRCRIYYMSERLAKRKLGEQAKPAAAINPKVPINLKDYEEKTGVKIDRSIFDALDEIIPLTRNKNTGTHYSPLTKSVNLQPGSRELKSKWQAESVVYHEYGHAIDWQKGMRKDGVVQELMNKHRKILSKNGGYARLNDQFRKDAYASRDMDEIERISAFADTLMALNPRYGFGHSKKYFALEGKKEAEFIAHAFENKFIGNPYFKQIAPDLYDDMIEYIEKYLK
ncbi:MAG: hypothetical protein EOO85_17010 [Pedobacter sp.]|nr:MAG: hypothetical protein EOO85_17010 [Pedobacter sp.]